MSNAVACAAKVRLGDMVIYHTAAGEPPINGHYRHPAVVCAVWSEDVVNLRVLTDGAGVEWRTSVPRVGTQAATAACWEPLG